ncbi:TPA: hypothetical protein HA238_04425 [Candidatus Micrarchaeota archaeon]|nr:hypothetical protein [Candidatus Micrarchaeota archaeon]
MKSPSTSSVESVGVVSDVSNSATTVSVAKMSDEQKIKSGLCPSCESNLTFQEGCKVCYSCGWGGCDG